MKDDYSIVLCGEAGQGIQTVEQLLVSVLKLTGYHVFATKEYMSRIRGGTNSTEIRVGSERVTAHQEKIDILVPISDNAVNHVKHRLTTDSIIIGEEKVIKPELVPDGATIIHVGFTDIAENIGNKIFSNIVAVGLLAAFFDGDADIAEDLLTKRFRSKGDEIVSNNIQAFTEGYELGNKLIEEHQFEFSVNADEGVAEEILFNGNQAVALGALAGGCNFISSYPMSPATGLLIFLAQHAREFGIVIDQAEDELAAMNKTIGAWYGGARAIVSTSGGGFALMTEGLSLAGMTESPLVVHVAQRPGPATGLPTRTAQEDLFHVLKAGHGEFQRAIFAPGTLEDAFYITAEAFNLADEYQVPIFVLTDQYFVDSYYNIPALDVNKIKEEKHFIETDKDYKRYTFTETGISPRGIPGYGEGLVRVDSDEHDQAGFITEDVLDTRPKMIDKRVHKRYDLLKSIAKQPRLYGSKDYKILVVAWGSTYHPVREAINFLDRNDIALLHFTQVYPLHESTREYLEMADQVIFLEQNATGQFADVVKLETGFNTDQDKVKKFLKSNGIIFAVDEIIEYLEEL